METDYPFSLSFGLANTREACVNSSRRTYDRLLRLQGTTDVLYFDTIALVAKNTDGTVEDDTLHRLYRLFRPDKDGRVAPLDFIKVSEARSLNVYACLPDEKLKKTLSTPEYRLLLQGGSHTLGSHSQLNRN